MNATGVWSIIVGTLPGFIISIILSILTLYLSYRNSRSLERAKADLQQEITKFSKWHEKRIESLEKIYTGFSEYLDFLRRSLYIDRTRSNMDPIHNFHRVINAQILYLDNDMAEKINTYSRELMVFWNQSVDSLSKYGESARPHIQSKLDFEIPLYLEKLRQDINTFLDPNYKRKQ